MSEFLNYLFLAFLLTIPVPAIHSERTVIPAIVYSPDGSTGPCPSSELQESVRESLIETTLQALFPNLTTCGGSFGWTQVVSLNMSDSSQQCPPPWILFTSPQRSCSTTSTITSTPGCEGITVSVPPGAYSQVCGRVTGYAVDSPDAFAGDDNIESFYLDGVSITHGSPRQHIWSLAAGHGANFGAVRCSCDNVNTMDAPLPPFFVGDNWFCDGDYNGDLWDAEGCTTDCCTFNSPPYFTATLPAPTSDDLEVRICTNENRDNEAVHVGLLQLYVR